MSYCDVSAVTPSQRARLPNLIVIGAGKAGTSSLHTYLDTHPQIGMSAEKEPNFFIEPDCLERLDSYLHQFDPGCDVRGESSPTYTQHPRVPGVAERIHRLTPSARLIYLVRDPVQRAAAHWAQAVSHGIEPLAFAEAFADLDPARNRYICGSSYATQLEEYLRWFPAEQILVLEDDDLRHRRAETLRRAFEFVGVDSGFSSPEFERELNPRGDLRRLTRAGRALRRSPAGAAYRRLPVPVWRRVGPLARRLVYRRIETPEVTGELRVRLEQALWSEASRFRELTGLAFERWSV